MKRDRERERGEKKRRKQNAHHHQIWEFDGNFIRFFSSFLDLNKQHTRINGFFAQLDIEKGKKEAIFVCLLVELFGCFIFSDPFGMILEMSPLCVWVIEWMCEVLAIETDVMT